MDSSRSKHIAVCGGGVIGSATAYWLSLKGARVSLIEEGEIACAASGFAGGFLAYDWSDGTTLQQLSRKSFDLHAALAETLGDRYDYRRVDTYSVARYGGSGGDLDQWLRPPYGIAQQLGTQATTAQVHPEKFTRTLVEEAQSKGARLVKGRVEAIIKEGGEAKGVVVDGEPLRSDAVAITLGPWSSGKLLGVKLPRMFGLQGHSIVIAAGKEAVPGDALFIDDELLGGPELVVRSDGEAYLSGISEQVEVPQDAASVRPRSDATKLIQELARRLSPKFEDKNMSSARACIRPVYRDGVPRIGKVGGLEGAYLASGHSVWGILNAPATGLALSELILEGESTSIDLSPFDPAAQA